MTVVSKNDALQNSLNKNEDKPIFVLLAGTTAVSSVKGISAAGANPAITPLTPAVDSEIIIDGKCYSMEAPPMTPSGIPTPALVTRGALQASDIDSLIVDAGMKVRPKVPYIISGLETSRNPAKETALPLYHRAFQFGSYIGRLLRGREIISIGETIPGGTTTSYMVLRSLGYSVRTSSSLQQDPGKLKEGQWKSASERSAPTTDPQKSMQEFGDYIMPVALGIMKEASRSTIILCGGTQMATVMKLSDLMGIGESKFLATTSWVYSHRKETIESLARSDRLVYSDIPLGKSRHEGLREYGNGNVREGAGMGGVYAISVLMGADEREILSNVDDLYDELRGTKP